MILYIYYIYYTMLLVNILILILLLHASLYPHKPLGGAAKIISMVEIGFDPSPSLLSLAVPANTMLFTHALANVFESHR